MGIEYWEVWNEPDFEGPEREKDQMWAGTRAQYFDMYAATARLFKKEMPGVNIGGYAACIFYSDFFPSFLQYVKDNSLPLDFFSWHIYTKSVDAIKERANYVRETLDKFGFRDTITILDEWNCIDWTSVWGGIYGENGEKSKYEIFSEASGEAGAAFAAAALIAMLELPVDIATFYDGHPTNIFCTIFDRYGVPSKQYYAFDAFNKLIQAGERVKTECGIGGVYAAAADAGDERICVLIANTGGGAGFYQLEFEGLQDGAEYACEIYLTDKYRTFDKAGESDNIPKAVYLYRDSLALIDIRKK